MYNLVGSLSNAALTVQAELCTEYLTSHIPLLGELEESRGLCEGSIQQLLSSSINYKHITLVNCATPFYLCTAAYLCISVINFQRGRLQR